MSARPLEILYVGTHAGTCLQRADALADLGHRVHFVNSGPPEHATPLYTVHRVLHRIKRWPDMFRANAKILSRVSERAFDVLWVDKGLMIRPDTLRRAKQLQPSMKLVTYSPDDMMNPVNQSKQYLGHLPVHDLVVTTKTYNVEELPRLGARHVVFVGNAYDPSVHRPWHLTAEERAAFATDLGFVGVNETERAGSMLRAAGEGLSVRVHGPGWERLRAAHPNFHVGEPFLNRERYAKAVCATNINLGFLRKANRDLQTQRSIEIPACGGFLLAERTDEHRALFEEGREAEFFDSDDEMIEKCHYYLAHEEERLRIAAAGRRRCLESGYSNQARMDQILESLDLFRT